MQVRSSLYVQGRQQPREIVDLPGTLRDQHDSPVDIVIEDISLSGFKCRCEQDVDFGTHVRVGLPGVGVRFARFVRQQGHQFGFEFTKPISIEQLGAIGNSTLVLGSFAQDGPAQLAGLAPALHLPIALKASVIIGTSGLLWVALVAGLRQLFF